MGQQLVYAAVIAAAAVVFFLPSIVAAIRGTDPLWVVLLLNVTTWLGAWLAIIMLPRNRPAPIQQALPVQRALPIQDDPRYLFGAVPPADPAGASRRQDTIGAGASVWS